MFLQMMPIFLTVAAPVLASAVLGLSGQGAGPSSTPSPSPEPGSASAAVDECLTSGEQGRRAATFSAQMVALPGTQRMTMRIDVQVRTPTEPFHAVLAPGLEVWRRSSPGVNVFKYLSQVTNLSAPASYRAFVRFRWLGPKGRLLRRAQRMTTSCVQPLKSAKIAPKTTQPATG
ncbi:MAG TPA: hypothetical protein VGX16_04570 [Solirubrobacteraceae bacterium]|nr:hypothetical protein [Solirubrobacteraceae bacterium]